MADWSGLSGTDTPTRYRLMAERELRGVSPSYERLALGVAADPELIGLLDTLPPPKRQPNLLFAAARLLGAPIEDYPAFRRWVIADWARLAEQMRKRRTQTNEPARCATLLPALATLPAPLALIEVGASAGLCLYPDRYGYRFQTSAGALDVGATERPRFPCRVGSPAPLPDALPVVSWRVGLDLNPLDVADADDVRWLQALVWPEQRDRAERLADAVELVRPDPPRIVIGDLRTDLDALIDEAPADATVVVFHTAVLAYLDEGDRAAFAEQMLARIAAGRAHWISNEGPGVFAHTAGFPQDRAGFVLSVDGSPVALSAPHGDSLDWLPS